MTDPMCRSEGSSSILSQWYDFSVPRGFHAAFFAFGTKYARYQVYLGDDL
jgi:hypothetical protein